MSKIMDKFKDKTTEVKNAVMNWDVNKKEKELRKKKELKSKLQLEKEDCEKRIKEINAELEITDAYIKVLTDEFEKMKK